MFPRGNRNFIPKLEMGHFDDEWYGIKDMVHTWKLSNFPCIYVLFTAKIGKIHKTGLSPSKTGFRRAGFCRILRFSNRGHSLATTNPLNRLADELVDCLAEKKKVFVSFIHFVLFFTLRIRANVWKLRRMPNYQHQKEEAAHQAIFPDPQRVISLLLAPCCGDKI